MLKEVKSRLRVIKLHKKGVFGNEKDFIFHLGENDSIELSEVYHRIAEDDDYFGEIEELGLLEYREELKNKEYDGKLLFGGVPLCWFCRGETEILEKTPQERIKYAKDGEMIPVTKEEMKTINTQTVESEANMDFGEALKALMMCNRVARIGWKREYIEIQLPDKDSKMTKPYIFLSSEIGNKVPWTPTQDDLLSTDWVLVT